MTANHEITEEQYEAAHRQLDYQRAQHELARLKSETAALESVERWNRLASAVVTEGVYDGFNPVYVDPNTPYYDSPGFSGSGEPLDQRIDPEDTKDGNFSPYWRNVNQYFDLQGTLRHLANGHEVGRNILDTLIDYIVHTGFECSAEASDIADQSDATRSLVGAVQKIIDEFDEAHDFRCCREAEIVRDVIASGESLLWLRHDGAGRTKLRHIPTAQIVEPKPRFRVSLEDIAGLPASSWTYGVATDLEDSSNIRAFFWERDHVGTNWDIVPVEEAVWIKWNTPQETKRGLSDFYPMLPILQLLPPVLRNIVVQTGIQASIAYIRKSTSGVPPTSQGIMPLGSTANINVPSAGGGTRNIASQIHRPGEIHDTAGVDYHAGPMGDSQAEGFLRVYEGALRTVGARWNMPEYLISSVADTSNRATAETAEQPWIRRIERMQGMIRPHFERLYRRVLAIAIGAGRLSEFGIRSIDDLSEAVQVKITPPAPKSKDPTKQIAADKILVDTHAMSKQTLAERNNLDWEQELFRLGEEQDNEVINPPPEPPLGMMGGMPPGDDKKPKPKPARESLDDFRQALTEMWGDYPGGDAIAEQKASLVPQSDEDPPAEDPPPSDDDA